MSLSKFCPICNFQVAISYSESNGYQCRVLCKNNKFSHYEISDNFEYFFVGDYYYENKFTEGDFVIYYYKPNTRNVFDLLLRLEGFKDYDWIVNKAPKVIEMARVFK